MVAVLEMKDGVIEAKEFYIYSGGRLISLKQILRGKI